MLTVLGAPRYQRGCKGGRLIAVYYTRKQVFVLGRYGPPNVFCSDTVEVSRHIATPEDTE